MAHQCNMLKSKWTGGRTQESTTRDFDTEIKALAANCTTSEFNTHASQRTPNFSSKLLAHGTKLQAKTATICEGLKNKDHEAGPPGTPQIQSRED